MRMLEWLEDQILAALQRRCKHPARMVILDAIEGASADTEVGYCRRCGAFNVKWKRVGLRVSNRGWRFPDPNLWRGK